MTVRPYALADAAGVAALNAAGPLDRGLDFEPRTAPDLVAFDATFARLGLEIVRFVAEGPLTGSIVGYAHAFPVTWQPKADRSWVNVRVTPNARGTGLGRRLFAALGPRGEVWAELREPLAALPPGARELFRSWEFERDLGSWSAPPPAVPAGITLASLADELRLRGPAALPALRDLYVAVNRDVPLPSSPDPELPLDAFVDYLTGWPTSLPEATLVARDGEQLVGTCILHRRSDDPACVDHHFTGIDPAARGRGLAKTLKHWTLATAQALGFERIRTSVESNNGPMLAVNEKLGFRHRGGVVVLAWG